MIDGVGIGPGPLNITFGSNAPITLLHLMLMSKIYVVNSDMKNVSGSECDVQRTRKNVLFCIERNFF